MKYPIISSKNTVKYNQNVYTKFRTLSYTIEHEIDFYFKPIHNITLIEDYMKTDQLVYADGRYINRDLSVHEINSLIKKVDIGIMYTDNVVKIEGNLLTGSRYKLFTKLSNMFN